MPVENQPTATQPVYFIPHGAGPCFFMEWRPKDAWDGMARFLGDIRNQLPELPNAILLVSAHWQSETFRVTSGSQPELIYDYYGFPEHTYQLTYPAPGSPELANSVRQALEQAGLGVHEDPSRGFDHGMFIPLKLMFPEADIPVVQLSLRYDLDPQAHLQAGQALSALRQQGVLIVGSGMSFHNMRGYGDPRFTPLSGEFDQWLNRTVADQPSERLAALQRWTQAPHARNCHPPREEEHLLPLMVATGAAGADPGRQVYSEKVLETWLSAFRFG